MHTSLNGYISVIATGAALCFVVAIVVGLI